MRRRFTPFDVADWAASAVIFAPHPDDETLGCGGVAAKKLASGVRVRFVFVTDGAASHGDRVAGDKLRAIREAEAVEAVRRLGGSAECVTFLRFPDGSAIHHIEAIKQSIVPLLDQWRPQSIYVTHRNEPPSDHIAANRAVWAAVRTLGLKTTLFEYPVWYWYHWPWMRMRGDLPGLWRMKLKQTLLTGVGLRSFFALDTRAYVGDALNAKREALAAHVSQVGGVEGAEPGPTLQQLSRGDFTARLLSDYETFARHETGI